MQLRTIVTLLGEVYGWYPAQREFISTIHNDGTRYTVRSRNQAKTWNAFIDGMARKLFEKLQKIKDSGQEAGIITAKIFYRGDPAAALLSLIWDNGRGEYKVEFSHHDSVTSRTFASIDRSMHGFFLKLWDIMKERMTVLTVTRDGGG
ncbi:MAG: hypothetical protein E7575_06135 [Ruminococcaceae bacterium]|nr:hypothetical protein [Oscillospiraceae bacterium]